MSAPALLMLNVQLAPSDTSAPIVLCRWCEEDVSDHPRGVECALTECIDCGEVMLAEGDPIVCQSCLFLVNTPEMRSN